MPFPIYSLSQRQRSFEEGRVSRHLSSLSLSSTFPEIDKAINGSPGTRLEPVHIRNLEITS